MPTRGLGIACMMILGLAGLASAIEGGVAAPSLTISIGRDLPAETRFRNALLGVQAYVEKRREPLAALLRNVKTPPIRDAAKVIARSGNLLAPAARLLAAVRLVAHARKEDDALAAVDVLIGERARQRLLRWLDAHGVHSGCQGTEQNPEKTVVDGLEAIVGEAGGQIVLAAPGACSDFYPWSNVDSPANTNDVSITMFADAGRTFDQARAKLDPRSWASCSTLWSETCLVEVQNGTPVFQMGKPKCTTIPQAPGDPYQDQIFYERLQCDGRCSLEMLLNVTTALPTADTYLVQYSQKQQVSGAPPLVGDDGFIKVEKKGNRVAVKSDKTLGFRRAADAEVVYLALRALDVTAYLAQLVCCP